MKKRITALFLGLILTMGSIMEVPAAITALDPFEKDASYNNSKGTASATTYSYYASPEYCLSAKIVYTTRDKNGEIKVYKVSKQSAGVKKLTVNVDIDGKFIGLCTVHTVRYRGKEIFHESITLLK